ncbi:carbohydrate ABC transporter permease [Aggregatilinea lenta]|uniref:carbohydrate ABC transporter permease n=1 Tax=Aggregatilinea lenta TaxID=913108 RepID=UPI000E5C05A0|nr:sugar ABC transporter permease [Aggregatilinea lenta]
MRQNRTGWIFLSPSLIILFIVGMLPFFYIMYVGFFDWNVFSVSRGLHYSGLDNYRRLVFDKDFLKSLELTIKFAAYAILFQLLIGYFLANMLAIDFPGKSIFRIIHTIPLMIAPLAVGATWRLLTIPGLGPVPFYLDRWLGFDYRISANADQAFWTTVIMDVWHWTPFVTLTMLAGLVSLPQEPMEQALVDGANRLQVFWYVKLPLLRPVILSTVFIRLMDALRTVDEVWMLTGGGPGAATRYTGLHIWRIVFPKTDYGYGAATSLLTLYFTIVLSWLLYTAIGQQRRGGAS